MINPILLVIHFLIFSSSVFAQSCATNSFGQIVCAPPGGGALQDNTGQVLVGKGQCVIDNSTRVMCSSVAGGGAVLSNGQAVCVGGCVPGFPGSVIQ